jgi:hypothetical protein
MSHHLCRCCCRLRQVNQHGLCSECAICLHCEGRPAVTELGLCEQCDGDPHIQDLYRRGPHWTPEWEMHLRKKTAEVQRHLQRRRRVLPPTAI